MSSLHHFMILLLFSLWSLYQFGDETSFYATNRMESIIVKKEFSPPDGQQIGADQIQYVPTLLYYLQTPFIDTLLKDPFYGTKTTPNRTYQGPSVSVNNKLIGIRLRQVRVKADSCSNEHLFDSMLNPCYGAYTIWSESIESHSGFPWKSSDELNEPFWWGRNAVYSGSGVVVDLPLRHNESKTLLNTLDDIYYFDLATRALMVDWISYNPSLRVGIQGRLLFEFLDSGGIIESHSIQTAHISRYEEADRSSLMSLEILLILCVSYSILSELFQYGKAKYNNEPYTSHSYGNYIVWLFFFMILITKVMWYRESITARNWMSQGVYYSLWKLIQIQWAMQIMSGCAAFFLWMRTFVKLPVLRRFRWVIDLFWATLTDLVGWFVVFFIVILAMSQMGFLFFNSNTFSFRSFQISIISLFISMFGGLETRELIQSNRVIGPMFFILFHCMVSLVLLNVFMAIIVDTFERLRNQEKETGQEVGVLDEIKTNMQYHYQSIKTWLQSTHIVCLCCKKKPVSHPSVEI